MITPKAFGQSLRGVGVNLLCRDVPGMAAFLAQVFGLSAHRVSADFAIVSHAGVMLQLHADATFASHPLHALLPEAGPRGAGVQLYLFGIDPDAAAARAEAAGGMVLEPPSDKPHGLREATILAPEGQAFSPAVLCA
jgi:predicted enzyme related to lactoylglutathione lyase